VACRRPVDVDWCVAPVQSVYGTYPSRILSMFPSMRLLQQKDPHEAGMKKEPEGPSE
jgi:hypothetical protein